MGQIGVSLFDGLLDELRKEVTMVTSDEIERKLYSHDVGTPPKLFRRFLGTADIVVKPQSVEELKKVLEAARKRNIPVIPRGKATSGYGGVIPVKGGIVLDLTALNRIIEIDELEMIAVVEPGVVWKRLDEELRKKGLTLRLYPTSYPSSTVAGWLAQEGAGIGSFAYGWFSENVEYAKVLLPDGEVRELRGEELKLVSGACGTTGIIVEVGVKVRKLQEEKIEAFAFNDAESLQIFIEGLEESRVNVWSVSFINPDGAHLKSRVPPKTHHGHPIEEIPALPEKFIAIVAHFDSSEKITEIAEESGGQKLDDGIAEHEWEERFNPMRIKRLGPSIIPMEAVIPASKLAEFIDEFGKAAGKHRYLLEGFAVKGGEIVLLGFVPHDERRWDYSMAWSLALRFNEIAEKLGGRPYSTGLYLAHKAEKVLGRERVEALRKFKAEVDAESILNPGKVIDSSTAARLIGIAENFSFASSLAGSVDYREKIPDEGRELPGMVEWFTYACAQCGYCVEDCTEYDAKKWESTSPRGKFYFLKMVIEGEAEFDQDMVNKFLLCTTCEKCNVSCQLAIPVLENWELMRDYLIGKRNFMTFPPFEIMAASLENNLNIWAGYRRNRADWLYGDQDLYERVKDNLSQNSEVAYFAGCTASFVEQDIAKAAVTLLSEAGIEFQYLGTDEACCGIPMLVAGKWDIFEKVMRHNIEEMKRQGVKKVITSCPACWLVWSHYYKEFARKLGIEYDIEAKHYTEVLAEKIRSGECAIPEFSESDITVTFHDSCHLGRAGGIYEPPRELIRAAGVKFVEMAHNRENALCCGSVLTRVGEPRPTSNYLGGKRIKEAIDAGADVILAVCPCCQFQLRVASKENGYNVPVKDLAAFISGLCGVEFQDPTDYCLSMWTTFDAMIALMQPKNMAELMKALMPQMIEAMPGSMKAMMKFARKARMLKAMKPLMPKMMPMLMPKIMPKVMPDMLKEVEKRVPMPEHMKEQMPDLMPKVMENLMPKMLPEVAPLVVDDMVEYIESSL